MNNDELHVQAAESPASMVTNLIDDRLQEYEFGLSSDEEIMEFAKLKNENETDVTFVRLING